MNERAIDCWTWTHIVTGYLAARMGMSMTTYMALSVAYEVVEQKWETGGSKFFGSKQPESKANVAVDLISGGLGHLVGQRTLR